MSTEPDLGCKKENFGNNQRHEVKLQQIKKKEVSVGDVRSVGVVLVE